MESVLGRYRNMTVLAAILFAQIVGLAVQVKRPTDPQRPDSEPTRLIRIWANSVVTPFEEALVNTSRWTRDTWHDYLYLRGLRKQNADLQTELDRMRIQEARLSEDAAQAHRLQVLLQFKEQFISQTVAAQVIGTSGSELSRVLTIDKGANDGLKPDMAVITPEGIVGKIVRVYSGTAQVLEINDQSSGVGAILEKSRLQGIVKGSPTGDPMLSYIMRDEGVQPGERVLTSGGDRVFPKGLPIGIVADVKTGHDLFYVIRLRPTANLSRVEEVLVITKVEDREPQSAASGESNGPVRAADILASRLPSVTPKAPADQKPGGAAAQAPNAGASSKPAGTASTAAAKPVTGTTVPAASAVTNATAKTQTAPVKPSVTKPNSGNQQASPPFAKPVAAANKPAAKPAANSAANPVSADAPTTSPPAPQAETTKDAPQ